MISSTRNGLTSINSVIQRASSSFKLQLRYCANHKTSDDETHYEEEEKVKIYPTHIPTTPLQKAVLALGSSIMSIADPWRHDMVAVCSETTSGPLLDHLWTRMSESEEGKRILEEKPIINSTTVDFGYLEALPENTFGHTYFRFIKDNNITPDSRDPVKFVDDPELAYIIRRYREIHDLVHCLCGMKTHMLGEVTIKWVEALQTNLPMTWGAAILGATRLAPKHRKLYTRKYLPWALKCGHESNFFLSIYFENRWNQDVTDLRNELRIPDLISE